MQLAAKCPEARFWNGTSCNRCSGCPVGHGVKTNCTQNRDTVCQECVLDFDYSNSSGMEACKGYVTKFERERSRLSRTANGYMHAIFNKHHKKSPRTLTQPQYRLWRGKQTIYLLKSLSNSFPHLETKISKHKNKTSTNVDLTAVINYFKLRLNETLLRLSSMHRIRYNAGHECQLANVVDTPRSAPPKELKRTEKTLTCSFHFSTSSLIDYRIIFQPIGHRNSVC